MSNKTFNNFYFIFKLKSCFFKKLKIILTIHLFVHSTFQWYVININSDQVKLDFSIIGRTITIHIK